MLRREMYLKSDPIFPNVRHAERKALLDIMEIQPHHTFCDVPAWGGYLANAIKPLVTRPEQITCVEASPGFYPIIDHAFKIVTDRPSKIGLPDDSFDRVGSLVGLHHYDLPVEPIAEMVRITKPGGMIGISEVIPDSPVARFLNGPVNRFTTGHKGKFISIADVNRIVRELGCTIHDQFTADVSWRFEKLSDVAPFVRNLLGMNRATEAQTYHVIKEHFALVGDELGWKLPWRLGYVFATKR